MKKFLCQAAFLLAVFAPAYSQSNSKKLTVPAGATSAFEKAYPGATKVKWGKEKQDYEANFVLNGQKMAAIYDAAGTLQETETDIPMTALPKPAQYYLKQHYKGTAREAARSTKASGEVNFEAEVAKKDVVFDANGKFLREEADED